MTDGFKEHLPKFSVHNLFLFICAIFLIVSTSWFADWYFSRTGTPIPLVSQLNAFLFSLIGLLALYTLYREVRLNRRAKRKQKPRRYPDNAWTAALIMLYGIYNYATYFLQPGLFSARVSFYLYQYIAHIGDSLPDFILISYLLSRLVFTRDIQKYRFSMYVVLSALLGWLTYFSRYFVNPRYLDERFRIVLKIFERPYQEIYMWRPLVNDIALFFTLGILVGIFAFFMFRHICLHNQHDDKSFSDYFLLRFLVVFLFIFVVKTYDYLSLSHLGNQQNPYIFRNLQLISIAFSGVIIFMLYEYTHRLLRNKDTYIRKLVLQFTNLMYPQGTEENARLLRVVVFGMLILINAYFWYRGAYRVHWHLAYLSLALAFSLFIALLFFSRPILICHREMAKGGGD